MIEITDYIEGIKSHAQEQSVYEMLDHLIGMIEDLDYDPKAQETIHILRGRIDTLEEEVDDLTEGID